MNYQILNCSLETVYVTTPSHETARDSHADCTRATSLDSYTVVVAVLKDS